MASLRWSCPDCPVSCVDLNTAMTHHEETGHAKPQLVLIAGRGKK